MRQRVSHALQASIALLGFVVFRALPVDLASWVGGALLRWIGPRLKVSHIARRNLRAAFPNKTDDILETIVRQMWDHLGRVLGEFPHSATLMADPNRVQVTRPDIIAALRDDGRPGIFFSAHIGNWELASVFTLR
ncbi:MAG: lipid A biosynthesis lauroyl acyltransferase, partial [Rhodospirillaceae bacterium]